MEFKRTEYKINVYGEEIKFRKPTGLEKKKWLVELGELAGKTKEGEAYNYDEDYRITKEFLSSLGFPEKTFDSMEENHQIEVIDSVVDIKKN